MPQADPNHSERERDDSEGNASDERESKRRIVFWIAVGIVAWGFVLAIGDFWANRDPRRPLIIVASVAIFVGFWLAMMRTRRSDETPKPPNS